MALGRMLLIVNPAAKHGETRLLLPAVRRLFDGLAEYELMLSSAPCEALDIARDSEGYSTVVAVGGDGTVHEVVNGLMARPAEERAALAVIPTGSGNDYARALGVSFDLATAVREIATGTAVPVDVGRCNDVWFANSVAFGLDARVTAKAVELKVTTKSSGLALYLRALMYVLFRQYYAHPITLAVDGGSPVHSDTLALAVMIGPTYGGGFRIAPDAVRDDGLFDICRIGPMPLPMALVRLPAVVLGRHTHMRPVHMFRATRLAIESERPLESQVDGEVMLDSRYDVEIVPCALQVIVPGRTARPDGEAA